MCMCIYLFRWRTSNSNLVYTEIGVPNVKAQDASLSLSLTASYTEYYYWTNEKA